MTRLRDARMTANTYTIFWLRPLHDEAICSWLFKNGETQRSKPLKNVAVLELSYVIYIRHSKERSMPKPS